MNSRLSLTWSIIHVFDFLDRQTTRRRNGWRVGMLLAAVAVMGSLVGLVLYYKTFLVYPRLSRASSLPDITQTFNDYLQYVVDLYHVHKYDKDMCAEYYKQYTNIDTFLNGKPESEVRNKLVKLLWIFTTIWAINFATHYITLWYEFFWWYPYMYVPFHIFVYSKILTTLFLSAHTLRIECRLRMMGDLVEDSYMLDGWQNVNALNECSRSRLTAHIKRSLEIHRQNYSKPVRYFDQKVERLRKFYLNLTEQCDFVNDMFGIRILLLSLNLTIDMVRFINSIYRYVGGNQLSLTRASYSLAGPSVMRTLVCIAMLFSLVHHCELAYRQTDRIIRLCDRVLITGSNKDGVKASILELRELVSSRPISFTVARFFRLEYPVLTAIAATVVSYSIILFQST